MAVQGQILKIDLTSGKMARESISTELRHKYVGGEGINSRLLWEHFLDVDSRIDPMSRDNVLIAGTGLLAGTGYGLGSKMKWTFKSPAYNLFGDSSSGGNFVFALRSAGIDHFVVTGRAATPSYIWIDDDRAEIRDASHLWGKDTKEVHRLISEELGGPDVETALIGVGPENGVRFGSIMVSGSHSAGRTGGGTVMASKNLKAIAVRGKKGIPVHNVNAFFQATDELLKKLDDTYGLMLDIQRRFGSTQLVDFYQNLGVNAFRNNQASLMPEKKARLINHEAFIDKLARAAVSCVGCVTGCSSVYKIKGDESPFAKSMVGAMGSRPEYGGLGAFGAMCDIADLPAVCHFWEKCNDYGIDVFEAGACSAFLMELWQREIIDEKDIDEWTGKRISLEWGNCEAVEMVIDSIALQNSTLGHLLIGGVYQAAKMIEEIKGQPVLQYALYGKGGATFIEEVRHTPSWAINFAVASRGCDHLKGLGSLDKWPNPAVSQFYFGTSEGIGPLSTKYMGAHSALQENRLAFLNSLGICIFLVATDPVSFPAEVFAQAVKAVAGLDMIGKDFDMAGERIVNLEKAFNSRMGLRRKDDLLCERWMKEPIVDGPGKGWKGEDYLETSKDEYYEWHGWDKETGLQTRKKLEELDMKDVADVLEGENALG